MNAKSGPSANASGQPGGSLMTPSVRRLRTNLRGLLENSSKPERQWLLKRLVKREMWGLNRDWRNWGRERKQLPPDGLVWRNWLILGGRGAGKTRAGAEWVRALALGLWPEVGSPAERIAIIGPTFDEVRLVMIEGKSGLLGIHMDDERPKYEPSKRLLTWPNGSIAQVFSADEPESLRGPQFDAAWCDELAKWRLASEMWDMLTIGMGGYIGGRSLEKVAGMVTGVGEVTGMLAGVRRLGVR